MKHGVASWIIKFEEVCEKHWENSRNNTAPVSTRKITYYNAVYQVWTHLPRPRPHRRRCRRLQGKIEKYFDFFSVHIEVLKLQKRQTYQNNLHSESWDMESLPESSSLKKFVKNTERTVGITPHQSLQKIPYYNELHCHGHSRVVVDDDVCNVI